MFFILQCTWTCFTHAIAATKADFDEEGLSEAQVFEWWDNGIIDGEEAQEILDKLEEGNMQEACILAEVYALEKCP
ncbi:MAG: hypothetical protein IKO21_05855, partial [Fibrobacter sp.]|nr:hypothetical protein [Fibrobacter sp.]